MKIEEERRSAIKALLEAARKVVDLEPALCDSDEEECVYETAKCLVDAIEEFTKEET